MAASWIPQQEMIENKVSKLLSSASLSTDLPNAELRRPPKGDRFELYVLRERSEAGTSDSEVSR
jgi:hypothetical protein